MNIDRRMHAIFRRPTSTERTIYAVAEVAFWITFACLLIAIFAWLLSLPMGGGAAAWGLWIGAMLGGGALIAMMGGGLIAFVGAGIVSMIVGTVLGAILGIRNRLINRRPPAR